MHPSNFKIIIFEAGLDTSTITETKIVTQPFSFQEAVGRLYTMAGYNIFKTTISIFNTFCVTGLFNGKPFCMFDSKDDRTIHLGIPQEFNLKWFEIEFAEIFVNTKPTSYIVTCKFNQNSHYSYQSFDVKIYRKSRKHINDRALEDIDAELVRWNKMLNSIF